MALAHPRIYQPKVVPGLRRIQDLHGYLKKDDLKHLAEEAGVPLCQIQAVASFFPHFRLEPESTREKAAPKSTSININVSICRDMACRMAGSADLMQSLQGMACEGVSVRGVSCLGRCDRPAAVEISVHDTNPRRPAPTDKSHPSAPGGHALPAGHAERFYLGKSADEIRQIVDGLMQGQEVAPSNSDAELLYGGAGWAIDPYREGEHDYAAIHKALAARRESLRRAGEILESKRGFMLEEVVQFQQAASGRQFPPDEPLEKKVLAAVLAWQTDADWANGPDMGGWADAILAEMDEANADLRGLGGAGIPATQKWRDVRNAVRTARRRKVDDRAFIVVNGDESEPGTFKDRELLLHYAHLVVEGVILAGMVTEASQGFIYIRHEYPEQIEACRREIRRAKELGLCGENAKTLGRPFPVSVFVSPGGYICGEQSALIEAMSDRRGEPRNIPPKLETNGLDDQPTLVSNVETFAWAPYIWLRGGAEYARCGVNGWRGKRLFSVSGDVKRPGVYEVPMGMTLGELIRGERYCQGMVGGELKALAPSGPSGGFLPRKLRVAAGLPRDHAQRREWRELAQRRGFDPAATELDILDLELELNLFRALSPTQALGAGLIVYNQTRNMALEAVNALEFFRNESCGKCVPCRIGSQKLAAMGSHLLAQTIDSQTFHEKVLPMISDLAETLTMTSICGLGRSVPMPLRTLIEYFKGDLNQYLRGSR